MLHEKLYHLDSQFLTLTYTNDYPASARALNKRHLSDFWKAIRKGSGAHIKYYACGEYGDDTGRAHFHAIVFSNKKIEYQEYWPYGFVYTGTVTADSVGYVAGYVDKKYSEDWEDSDRPAPFQRQSQGLGLSFLEDHIEDILDNGFILFRDVKCRVPRYYNKKIEELVDGRTYREYRQKALAHSFERELNNADVLLGDRSRLLVDPSGSVDFDFLIRENGSKWNEFLERKQKHKKLQDTGERRI